MYHDIRSCEPSKKRSLSILCLHFNFRVQDFTLTFSHFLLCSKRTVRISSVSCFLSSLNVFFKSLFQKGKRFSMVNRGGQEIIEENLGKCEENFLKEECKIKDPKSYLA